MLKHLIDQATNPERVVILGSAGFVGNVCTQRLKAMDIPVLELPRTELDLTDSKSGDLLADLLRPNDSLSVSESGSPCPVRGDKSVRSFCHHVVTPS